MQCARHDILRDRGPAFGVLASSTFVDAASTQAEALGLPDVKRVFVPHPIQDATDDEMVAKADEVIDELVAARTDS